MKLVDIIPIMSAGAFPQSQTWSQCLSDLTDAIKQVEWPVGAGQFLLDPEYDGRDDDHENGVKPIKEEFQNHLKLSGWQLEARFPVVNESAMRPGRIDALKSTPDGRVAAEWETGNISSSHRALNKMALGILTGRLVGGALILPSRQLYKRLTDRIGNISEIEPYFPLWRSIPVENGVLVVMVIEHDGLLAGVGPIPKGTDGRARG